MRAISRRLSPEERSWSIRTSRAVKSIEEWARLLGILIVSSVRLLRCNDPSRQTSWAMAGCTFGPLNVWIGRKRGRWRHCLPRSTRADRVPLVRSGSISLCAPQLRSKSRWSPSSSNSKRDHSRVPCSWGLGRYGVKRVTL